MYKKIPFSLNIRLFINKYSLLVQNMHISFCLMFLMVLIHNNIKSIYIKVESRSYNILMFLQSFSTTYGHDIYYNSRFCGVVDRIHNMSL